MIRTYGTIRKLTAASLTEWNHFVGHRMDMHYLDKLFNPNSIALIRATGKPAALGFQVFNNLLQGGFSGEIYLINPKHRSIQGRPCYASVNAVSKPTEMLALVANLGFDIRPDENDHTLQIATKLFI